MQVGSRSSWRSAADRSELGRNAPTSYDLAAEMEVLVPQMHDALGPDAATAAAEAGAAMSTDDAIQLAITMPRAAADNQN